MKERIQWIDEAKGIGILLVMFGHCYLHWDFCFWFIPFIWHCSFSFRDTPFQERKDMIGS
ncbi:hypothetical protein [Ruminococcus sp.]|uniref:hypothetical protein n=1 Tax=Ruminococcus sp. TaxID=41978 RepID=UPI0039969A42